MSEWKIAADILDLSPQPSIMEQYMARAAAILATGDSVRFVWPDGSATLHEPYMRPDGTMGLRTKQIPATKSQPL